MASWDTLNLIADTLNFEADRVYKVSSMLGTNYLNVTCTVAGP